MSRVIGSVPDPKMMTAMPNKHYSGQCKAI